MFHGFDYAAPRTLDDLLALLAKEGDAAAPLAGGTDLLVDSRAGIRKFKLAVDVKRVPDADALAFRKGEGLSIGMGVTMAALAADRDVRRRFPLLAEAALEVGSPQIRNRATVVGNLCTASPCADMGRALLALEAEVEIVSAKGARRLPLPAFWRGVKRTALEPGEIVSRAIVPAAWADAGGGNFKLKRIRGHDLAVASVTLAVAGGRVRVAAGSAAPTAVAVEKPLGVSADALAKAVDAAIEPIDDLRASADYRRHMIGVYVRRLAAAHATPGRGKR